MRFLQADAFRFVDLSHFGFVNDDLHDTETERADLTLDNFQPGRQFIAVVFQYWLHVHNIYQVSRYLNDGTVPVKLIFEIFYIAKSLYSGFAGSVGG
jgi:hypothetical protein